MGYRVRYRVRNVANAGSYLEPLLEQVLNNAETGQVELARRRSGTCPLRRVGNVLFAPIDLYDYRVYQDVRALPRRSLKAH